MLNQVTLIGRLTRDPETKSTQNGTRVGSMGIAVDDGYGQNKKTVFVDVTTWQQTAEFCVNYLQKGNLVSITGRLSMDTWDDRNTGQKRQKLFVTADRVQCLEKREQQAAEPTQQPDQDDVEQPPPFPEQPGVIDEIPF